MEYNKAIEYIENLNSFGVKPSLKRIENLLNLLNNPQKNLKVIHVAGTNGKGSTCVMLENILIASGYKVGLYTSPHLIKYNERIKINNNCIDDETFSNLAELVISKYNKIAEANEEKPTLFEVLTAIAFCYFDLQNVDYAILEVGIGGRYDATNIIKSPILSIITSIGLDHTKYLGDTVEKIAFEKGGIIKNNTKTVLYPNSNKVYNIINKICNETNSKLYYCDFDEIKIKLKAQDLSKISFSIKTKYYSYQNVESQMIGEYQFYNIATVLTAVEVLKDIGLKLEKSNVLAGLKQSKWSGRMELISVKPPIILDGAHNIDGMKMLKSYINKYLNNKKVNLLIGFLKDKNYKDMIDILIPLTNKLIITEPSNYRALTVEEFANIISLYDLPVYLEKDSGKAFKLAKQLTNGNEILICVGSLYLIGELKNIIYKENKYD